MAQRKIRARYKVIGPRREPVTYTKAVMERDELQEGKVHTMQLKQVTEEMETFMVMFPQGHSIRVTSRAKLAELGYDRRPRMVDMETGDVVDVGGDLYDFDDAMAPEPDVLIDEDIRPVSKRRTADANA